MSRNAPWRDSRVQRRRGGSRGGRSGRNRHGRQRAGRRHQAQGVGFGTGPDVQDNVGLGRQRGLDVADDGDERRLERTQRGQQADEFGRGAGARDKDHRVAGLQDAEIAVHRISGVQEDRGRPGAAPRGGDLLRDQAGFADAAEHDLAGMRGDQVDGLGEGAVKARGELSKCRGFGLQQGSGGVEGSGHGANALKEAAARPCKSAKAIGERCEETAAWPTALPT